MTESLSEAITKLQPLFMERAAIEERIAVILAGGVREEEEEPPIKRKYERKVKPVTRKAVYGKGRSIPDDVKRAVVADYQAGELTMSDIAKKHGIGYATAYNIVKGASKNVSTSVPTSWRIKEYRCLGCGQTFKSTLSKLDAYCPGKSCNKTTELEEVVMGQQA